MRAIETRRSLIDEVHDRLVQAIADGTLAPGARLAQEEVAARLGVSRQPVSHALAILKRQGLAVEQGRRGLVVAALDPDRIRDLYEVRAALDATAARLAAERAAAGTLPDKARSRLEAVLDQGVDALDSGKAARLIEADVAFHDGIYQCSGNSAIPDTVRDMWPHFRRCMGAVLSQRDLRRTIWEQHRAIAAAILSGDAVRAGSLARDHALHSSQQTWLRMNADGADAA